MSTRRNTVPRPALLAAVALPLLLAACVDTGPTTTERRAVGDFATISASAGLDVHVVVGGAPSVTVTAGAKVQPHIVTRVDGDRLSIATDGSTHGRIAVEVTMPRLAAVDASSSASVRAEGVNGPRIEVNTSSGATVDLAGSADTMRVNSSSQSSATLGGLTVRVAEVDVSSQARAEVRATASVSGGVSSQATLTVLGSPAQVDVSTSSGGSVERR